MIARLESLFDSARQALDLLVDRVISVDPWWLVAGIVLYWVSQVVRTRGWFNILRSAYPGRDGLRARDVAGAYLAGVGLNSLIPARGGDFLKLHLVRRRLPGATYPGLLATLAPEALPEMVMGGAFVCWALAHGFLPVPLSTNELPQLDVSFVMVHPILSAIGGIAASAAAVLIARWCRRRARGFASELRRSFEVLRAPRRFVIGVGGPQALGRLIRLGALVCFMAAVGLPVTVNTAVLAMAAQSVGIIPFAPASAGIRVAMLTYGFAAVTDRPIDVAGITSFWFTAGAVHLVGGLVFTATVLAATYGTLSPRAALGALRAARAQVAAAAR